VVVARIGFCLGLAACATADPAPVEPALFISDYRANAIVRYDLSGNLLDMKAGDDQRLDRPVSARRGPDGQLYSAGFGRGDINRYDLATGEINDVFYWDTVVLEEPVELEFAGDHLYVLGNDTKNLVEIDRDGQFVRELGYPLLRGAQDFVIDGARAYVATEHHPTLGASLQVWNLDSGTLERSFATFDEVSFASGLTLHEGTLLVSDLERGTITRFDPATGDNLGVLATGLAAPVEIDIGPDGALYALDLGGLHRLDATTGEALATLVRISGGPLERPLGFTFVTD